MQEIDRWVAFYDKEYIYVGDLKKEWRRVCVTNFIRSWSRRIPSLLARTTLISPLSAESAHVARYQRGLFVLLDASTSTRSSTFVTFQLPESALLLSALALETPFRPFWRQEATPYAAKRRIGKKRAFPLREWIRRSRQRRWRHRKKKKKRMTTLANIKAQRPSRATFALSSHCDFHSSFRNLLHITPTCLSLLSLPPSSQLLLSLLPSFPDWTNSSTKSTRSQPCLANASCTSGKSRSFLPWERISSVGLWWNTSKTLSKQQKFCQLSRHLRSLSRTRRHRPQSHQDLHWRLLNRRRILAPLLPLSKSRSSWPLNSSLDDCVH